MSTQYLTVDPATPPPAYDQQEMAQGLGWGLMIFLTPLLYEVNVLLDKRQVRTFNKAS
jgi:hypothetical protein